MTIFEKHIDDTTVAPLADHSGLFVDEADGLFYVRLPDGSLEPLKGDTGATGPAGADGADGVGVPTGGTAGQYLRKVSGTDFDTAFATIAQSEVTDLVTDLAAKALDVDLDTEETARLAADAALDTRIDALEIAPPAHTHPQSEVTDLVGDLGDIDSRLDQLELGSPPPEAQGTWLASGGLVAYISGLTFRVSPATYYINGTQYSSPQTDITLDAADPSDERFDAIALTTSGTAVKVTGVAAADPAFPNIDPETQLALTYVHVNAGATDPGITLTDIYKEDAEWTSSVSGGTFNAASATDPFAGTVSIEATAAGSGDFVRLTNGAAISLNDQKQVTLNIKSKASWPNQKSLVATWYLAGVKKGQSVAVGNNKFGFISTNTTSYQQIVLPMSAFAVPAADTVDRLELKVSGGGGAIGFFVDNIILEESSGGVTPPSVGAATQTTLGLVRTDVTDANPQVYLKTSVDTLLAGKSNTGHTHGQADVTNLTTDLAALDTRIDALETSGAPPLTHASTHQNAGADEINVGGLNGVLADPQPTTITQITDASAFAKTLLDDADAAAARTTLSAAAASHAHAASDVTSGVFADARLASDNDAGNSGAADTIDWSVARSQKSTLTGNVTYTFSNPVAGATYVLRVHTGAGGFTTTWPSDVHWNNNVAPVTTTTASKLDIYTFHYADGIYVGVISAQNVTP